MTAGSFRLYDVLNCCATAVDESESERPANAETAWLEACIAGDGLFAPGSAADAAVGVILDACRPADTRRPGHAALWNALDAASLAVLPAREGDRETTALCLPDAGCAASLLPPDLRDAMTVILGEIRAMAETAVAA